MNKRISRNSSKTTMAPKRIKTRIVKDRFTKRTFYGVYPAVVKDIVDPENIGRVKVHFPWSLDQTGESFEPWAQLATLMAGSDRGTWFIPDVNDQVLVAFEGGNPRTPYIVGSLWDTRGTPPEQMDSEGRNYRKTILSREGVRITLDDTIDAIQLRLETLNGQRITLSDANASVVIEDSNGNSIKLDASGITVAASAKVSINASSAEISAGMLTVNAGMSKFSGMVQCDTLIANSVVSSSYSPGAGNIW